MSESVKTWWLPRKSPRHILFFVVMLIASAMVANAAGQLDTSFGDSGKVRTGFPGTDFGFALAVLDPGDRNAPNFPQYGQGSIKLGVLFNNPNDPE